MSTAFTSTADSRIATTTPTTAVAHRSGYDPGRSPVLIGDPRITALDVRDNGEALVALDWMPGTATGAARLVRTGLAQRLAAAQRALPDGVRLYLSEGFRPATDQLAIIAAYTADLSRRYHLAGPALDRLVSRYVAPLATAPHVAGAAVDVTLADADGRPLWLGCELDATPEDSHGACFFDAPGISDEARALRALMLAVLGGAGLVNYPTEWWHWSYGDRYWAYRTRADAACYGPVSAEAAGTAQAAEAAETAETAVA